MAVIIVLMLVMLSVKGACTGGHSSSFKRGGSYSVHYTIAVTAVINMVEGGRTEEKFVYQTNPPSTHI